MYTYEKARCSLVFFAKDDGDAESTKRGDLLCNTDGLALNSDARSAHTRPFCVHYGYQTLIRFHQCCVKGPPVFVNLSTCGPCVLFSVVV